MRSSGRWVSAAAVVLLAAACDESATGPTDGLDADDAAFVAVEADAMAGAMVFDLVGVGPVMHAGRGVEGEFERSRDCPGGGTFSIAGESQRTEHGDGSIEWSLEAEGEWDDCTHTRSRGDRSITTVIDGSFTLEAHRRHNHRVAIGNQIMSKAGSFTWTRTVGDETRTGDCTFEIESVRNPDSRRITVSGHICGREFERTVSWRNGI